jgi:hypothetical protein
VVTETQLTFSNFRHVALLVQYTVNKKCKSKILVWEQQLCLYNKYDTIILHMLSNSLFFFVAVSFQVHLLRFIILVYTQNVSTTKNGC